MFKILAIIAVLYYVYIHYWSEISSTVAGIKGTIDSILSLNARVEAIERTFDSIRAQVRPDTRHSTRAAPSINHVQSRHGISIDNTGSDFGGML